MKKEARKTVAVFALASFLNDLGSDMVYPLWPVFVTSVLGANMAVLGFLDGLGEALVSLSQAVSGYLSDRWRRRKVFIVLGYSLAGLARWGYSWAPSWRWLVPFRVLDRLGKMRGAPRDAMVAEVSDERRRAKNFGLLRAMDHLGAVVGVALAVLLFDKLGYRKIFLLAAVPSFIGVGLISWLVKEKGVRGRVFKGIRLKDLSGSLRLFLLLNAVFGLAAFSYSFLLLFARQSGVAAGFLPLLYLVFTGTAAVTSFHFGRLADRIGRKPVMGLALGLWALTCLSVVSLRGYLTAVGAMVVYGLHLGAWEPVQRTLGAELAPKQWRASVLGGVKLVRGLVALPASVIAGWLWDRMGVAAPFYFSLVLTLVAAGLLAGIRESDGGER